MLSVRLVLELLRCCVKSVDQLEHLLSTEQCDEWLGGEAAAYRNSANKHLLALLFTASSALGHCGFDIHIAAIYQVFTLLRSVRLGHLVSKSMQ